MLSVDGLDETIELIRGVTVTQEKVRQFLTALADIGVSVAKTEYASAPNDWGKSQIPTVGVEFVNANTVCIRASGTDVLFFEFGTGITYMQEYPADEGFAPTFKAGDWSDNEELGGRHHWDDPKGWYIPGGHGLHTYGIPPTRAMYDARKKVRQQIEAVAKEVFGI